MLNWPYAFTRSVRLEPMIVFPTTVMSNLVLVNRWIRTLDWNILSAMYRTARLDAAERRGVQGLTPA